MSKTLLLIAAIAFFGAGCTTTQNVEPTVVKALPTAAPATSTNAGAGAVQKTTTGKVPVKPKPASVKTITVTIQNNAFSPQIIAANAGDTVVWVNKDSVPHTSASDGSILWDSGAIQPGAKYSHTFKSTGTYAYHCGVHPDMHGTIYVYDTVK